MVLGMLKQSKFLRRLVYSVGFICLLSGALWFYPEPKPYTDPARIQIQRPELQPEENAYLVWRNILSELQQSWTAEEIAALNQALKSPNDPAELEQALVPLLGDERQQELWTEFLRSLELPSAVTPMERPVAEMAEPSLDFLFLSRAIEARGKIQKEKLDWSAAVESAFRMIHMGQVFQLSHGSSRFYILGCAIEASGLYLIQNCIGDARFNDLPLVNEVIAKLDAGSMGIHGNNAGSDESWRKQACLEALQNEADFLVDLITNEEWFRDKDLNWFQTVAPGMNYFLLFNPAKTGALIAGYRQKLTESYGHPYTKIGSGLNKEPPSMIETLKTLPTGNMFGVFIGELLTPTMEVILIRDIIIKTRLNGIRASLELKKLYLEEIEAAPENFLLSRFAEKAEPKIQESLSMSGSALDHFTGKNLTLTWESENRAVFSSTGRDQANPSDDLTFAVNFPDQPNIAPESGAL